MTTPLNAATLPADGTCVHHVVLEAFTSVDLACATINASVLHIAKQINTNQDLAVSFTSPLINNAALFRFFDIDSEELLHPSHTEVLPVPVPVNGVKVICDDDPCNIWVAVIGRLP